jgi:hypothetical protein
MDDQEPTQGRGGATTPASTPKKGVDGQVDSVIRIDEALRLLARLLAHAEDVGQPSHRAEVESVEPRETDGG